MRRLATLLILCVIGTVYAEEQLRPQDFAHGIPLHTSGREGMYKLNLPLAVYQSLAHDDLRDLRVFNAQGEVVPYALKRNDLSTTATPQLVTLPFFPVKVDASRSLQGLKLNVYKNEHGAIVNIDSNNEPEKAAKLAAYIVDAGSLKAPLSAVQLEWEALPESFIGQLRIEASDDLGNWRTIANGAPLASLQFAGRNLEQKRIEFPGIKARYLRFSWPDRQSPLILKQVIGELIGHTVPTSHERLLLNAAIDPKRPHQYFFDTGAKLPIDRISIELSEANTLAQVNIYSRSEPNGQWRHIANTVAYKLNTSNQELKSPDIAIANNNHRYWLLEVQPKGGGVGQSTPKLLIKWTPHQLFFIPRGNPPFMLAYGSYAATPGAFQLETLIPDYKSHMLSDIKFSQAGTPISLGGEEKLKPAYVFPWKKWLLWGVLIVAVMTLGFIAYRLVKQLGNSDNKGEPN